MLQYGFEFPPEERVRAAFVGCGRHSFRNVYPALRYAPIDLQAVCDMDEDRAKAYAREFGAHRTYTDVDKMLDEEDLEAVFVVTNYDENWLPRFPQIAISAMQAGCHAWIEKPPAGSVAEIEEMQRVEKETGKFTQVGFKKMFFPAVAKLYDIAQTEAFGGLTSMYVRYPERLVDMDQRDDNRAMVGYLDHVQHPMSIIQYLGGPVNTLFYERARNGATVTAMTFTSGAIGTLHQNAGRSATGPLERVEIVGDGENAVVDNGCKLTYYRKGNRGPGGYGRSPNFIGDDDTAPIYWEPEWSLGQLYNKGLFIIGYVPEVVYFAEHVKSNTPPEKAGLDDALQVTKVYEAYRYNPPGKVITVNDI